MCSPAPLPLPAQAAIRVQPWQLTQLWGAEVTPRPHPLPSPSPDLLRGLPELPQGFHLLLLEQHVEPVQGFPPLLQEGAGTMLQLAQPLQRSWGHASPSGSHLHPSARQALPAGRLHAGRRGLPGQDASASACSSTGLGDPQRELGFAGEGSSAWGCSPCLRPGPRFFPLPLPGLSGDLGTHRPTAPTSAHPHERFSQQILLLKTPANKTSLWRNFAWLLRHLGSPEHLPRAAHAGVRAQPPARNVLPPGVPPARPRARGKARRAPTSCSSAFSSCKADVFPLSFSSRCAQPAQALCPCPDCKETSPVPTSHVLASPRTLARCPEWCRSSLPTQSRRPWPAQSPAARRPPAHPSTTHLKTPSLSPATPSRARPRSRVTSPSSSPGPRGPDGSHPGCAPAPPRWPCDGVTVTDVPIRTTPRLRRLRPRGFPTQRQGSRTLSGHLLLPGHQQTPVGIGSVPGAPRVPGSVPLAPRPLGSGSQLSPSLLAPPRGPRQRHSSWAG